ncbi:MAG: hypothetical protein AB7O43_17720 [Hyphomicrobiaceae bacterium]
MLMLNRFTGFGVGRVRPTISNTHNAATATDSSAFNFTSCSIGAEASNRHVVVVAGGSAGSGATGISSLVINGVSATQLVSSTNTDTGQSSTTEIWIAAVPTGTSVTITPTYASERPRQFISVYAVYGLSSATAVATQTSTANNPTLDLNVQGGGVVIAGAIGNNSTAYTWSGLTEAYDTATETVGMSSAYAGNLSTATPKAVSATRSAAPDPGAATACAVSLR